MAGDAAGSAAMPRDTWGAGAPELSDVAVGRTRLGWAVAGAACALSTALLAIATFVADRKQQQVDAFPALVVFVGIATGLVFAFAVRPVLVRGSCASRRPVALAGLAVLSMPVFYTGLPTILGAASLTLRPYVQRRGARRAALALAATAIGAHTLLAFIG